MQGWHRDELVWTILHSFMSLCCAFDIVVAGERKLLHKTSTHYIKLVSSIHFLSEQAKSKTSMVLTYQGQYVVFLKKNIIDVCKQLQYSTAVARSYNATSEMTIQHVQVTDGWYDHQILKH